MPPADIQEIKEMLRVLTEKIDKLFEGYHANERRISLAEMRLEQVCGSLKTSGTKVLDVAVNIALAIAGFLTAQFAIHVGWLK